MHDLASTFLAGFLVLAAAAHFLAPSRVQDLVPEWWPLPRLTVYASGVAELLIGTGLLVPRFQHPAAVAAVAMFTAYSLVHLDDLRHRRSATRAYDRTVGVLLRVATNLGYAAWAGWVALGWS